nr:lysophospholipid acyltransferase family protein [Petrachloros mirabilis]
MQGYFGTLHVSGQEHLPPQGPVVWAVKHYSRWDPLVIAQLSPKPLYFMTNANQFVGFQGWLIQRLGAFPVDLNRPQLSSLRSAVTLLHQGQPLVIFPEGGIVRDRPLRSLKPGAARLVLQAEATAPQPGTIPIVPIGLKYDPAPQVGAQIWIQIGKPLSTADLPPNLEVKMAAHQLTQQLQAALLDCLMVL